MAHLHNAVRFARGDRASRSSILRSYYFRLSRSMTPMLLAGDEDMRFLVSTRDDVIGRHLFGEGSFDLDSMEAVISELRRRDPTGLTRPFFIDVGANIGTSTVAALSRFGFQRAIAIEPDPDNFLLLDLNLRLNSLGERARAVQSAVSDGAGELRLVRADGNFGDHRVLPAGVPPPDGRQIVQVPATTIDALMEAEGLRAEDVSLLWVDAQGYDGHVLAGAETVTGGGVPVVIEFWPEALHGAGGLEGLLQTIANRFTTVIDMGSPYAPGRSAPRELPAAEIEGLVERYAGAEFADLILLP